MCGRFVLSKPDKIKGRFDASNEMPLFEPSYNIAPGMITPVITRNSPNRIVMMKWGLVPFWSKDPKIGYKMINARAEGIESKPAFRKPTKSQRCLIPTDGFYEWKTLNLEGKEEKFPWYIGLNNRKLFAFAGIYDIWKDAEGKEFHTYAIITTKSNSLMKKVHDRMPVMLKKDDESIWLSSETPFERVLKLLKPYPAKDMESYPVSKMVNNPRNDGDELIKEVKR